VFAYGLWLTAGQPDLQVVLIDELDWNVRARVEFQHLGPVEPIFQKFNPD
jgi:hypothetical protein